MELVYGKGCEYMSVLLTDEEYHDIPQDRLSV